ncbi:MAG TPA: HAMP domain-containing sensor histidine kinase [Nocardioidaceae bacterium]
MEPDRTEELDAVLRELAAAREELARSREQLTLFAGQVSHELRTPLTAILAGAEMLGSEPTVSGDEDLTWMVQGIARAAGRLEVMVEEMVSYARDGGVPVLRVTDLGRVFDAALEDLAPLVEETDAKVVLQDLPVLPADRSQMYAVALNLLSNALTHTRSDTAPHVEIAADRVDDRWRVTVSDNGPGIPPERREAMFVLFARADKRANGSGIGLAVVRRVVEAHGGRTGIETSADGGTAVWVELPA